MPRKNEPEYRVEEKDGNWCCMKILRSGEAVEHICFGTEDEVLDHMETDHDIAVSPVSSAARAGSVRRGGATAGGAGRSLKKRGKKPPQKTTAKAMKYVGDHLNVTRDVLDFRDRMYEASLFEVPVAITLADYKQYKVPVLNQGKEGACTGYGLATVANYLLRRRQFKPDTNECSARMLYELAKRYDEWPGTNYSGSSARGAMKGWHKHGLCQVRHWPNNTKDNRFNEQRTADALQRPLGAYYRVNHRDLVAMHTALAEVGILYATAQVHSGWDEPGADGTIPFLEDNNWGHAFAIVAYDEKGFWIQNSWGTGWGKQGLGQITYDDWLLNGTDVWVARLGAPVLLQQAASTAKAHATTARKSNAYSFADLRPHIISLGNQGTFRTTGEYGTSAEEVDELFNKDFDRVTKGWDKRRLLLYAHGGLVGEKTAVQRLADYREPLLESKIYPMSIIWHTDAWTTLSNVLQDAVKRNRPEGFLDSAKDFLLDRLDDALEPLARRLTGKLQWDEMKENAMLATSAKNGGLNHVIELVKKLSQQYKNFEVHLVGHSAGSILLGPFAAALKGASKRSTVNIDTCTLWAPAITTKDFKKYYLPSITSAHIRNFCVFNLTDDAEKDDHCAHVYHKSLLYLVSNAFEDAVRIPFTKMKGTPLLGLAKSIEDDMQLKKLFTSRQAELVLAPNVSSVGERNHSTCTSHGGFDDDKATLNATMSRILGATRANLGFQFERSASSLRDRRQALNTSSML
jgi:hypothetical protein